MVVSETNRTRKDRLPLSPVLNCFMTKQKYYKTKKEVKLVAMCSLVIYEVHLS